MTERRRVGTGRAVVAACGATDDALVLRNMDDPYEIIAVLGWHDLKQARLFSQSVSLQVAMKTMGVVGVPEVRFWRGWGWAERRLQFPC